MKTTLEIPDELFREAKSKAALDGRKLKDLVAEGLHLVLHGSEKPFHRIEFPLISSDDGPVITSEQVEKATLDEWQDEAERIARFTRR